VPLDGVVPLAPSLDCAGVIGASLDAVRRVAEVVLGRALCPRPAPAPSLAVASPEQAKSPAVRDALAALSPGARVVEYVPADWVRLHRSVVGRESLVCHGRLLADP